MVPEFGTRQVASYTISQEVDLFPVTATYWWPPDLKHGLVTHYKVISRSSLWKMSHKVINLGDNWYIVSLKESLSSTNLWDNPKMLILVSILKLLTSTWTFSKIRKQCKFLEGWQYIYFLFKPLTLSVPTPQQARKFVEWLIVLFSTPSYYPWKQTWEPYK